MAKKLSQAQKLAKMTPAQRNSILKRQAASRRAAEHKARVASVSTAAKNAVNTNFAGSYDAKKLAELTDSVFRNYSGKKTVAQMQQIIKNSVAGGSITTNPTARRAGFTVKAEVEPMLAALDQQIREQDAAKRRELASTKSTYADLLAQQQAGAGRVNSAYTTSRANMGSIFDELANKSNAAYDQSEQSARGEIDRLGLGSVNPAALAGIQSDKARAAGIASTGKAYTQSLADMGKQGFDQLMGLLQGEGRQEGTQRAGDITSDYNSIDAILKNQRGVTTASQRPKTMAAYYGIQDANAAAKAEGQQQAFLNQLASSKLGLSQQEMLSLSDLRTTQSQSNLATARKNIIDSLRPTVIR